MRRVKGAPRDVSLERAKGADKELDAALRPLAQRSLARWLPQGGQHQVDSGIVSPSMLRRRLAFGRLASELPRS